MNMIVAYYGQNGIMTEGWDTKEEAEKEFNDWYQDDEYSGCYVAEYNGKWVIAF